MSINKVLSFLKRQGVLAVFNNKKLDTDLAASYLSVLFESDKYSDQYVSNQEYFVNSVKKAFLFFDCSGLVNKIYTSLCYFFDEVLSKEDYYLLADKLIHKIYITKHLSKYIKMHKFVKNCTADFDPATIDIKKTDGMILKDEKSFLSTLKRDFHYKRIVLCYDQLPGVFIFDTSTTFLDLEKNIYVYFFDVNGETYQFDDDGIQVNKRRKTVTVSLPMRSNVLLSNSPIIRRTVQKLDDKTAELQKLAEEAKQSEEQFSTALEKTDESILQTEQEIIKDEKIDLQQDELPETKSDEVIEDETIEIKHVIDEIKTDEVIEVKPLTSKEIRVNPELLATEKTGLKKAIVSNYKNKFFFYPAISAGRYKLSIAHLKTLDLTTGFCMKGFGLESFDLLDEGVKILGRLADGTIVYEVTKDCHVVVFEGRNPEIR